MRCTLTLVLALQLGLLLGASAALADGPTRKDLALGDHHWGHELASAAKLDGVVALIALTDELSANAAKALIKLARAQSGKPFHLVVGDLGGSNAPALLRALRGAGLQASAHNVTVTSETSFPEAQAPAWILLDASGNLIARETGDKKLRQVTAIAGKLVRRTPEIHLDRPFKHFARLAARVQSKSGFPGTIIEIQNKMVGAAGDAEEELQLLYNACAAYRDRQVAWIRHLQAHDPARARREVDRLLEEMAGSEMEVKNEHEELHSASHDRAIAIGKAFAGLRKSTERSLERAKDDAARTAVLEKTAARADKLIAGYEGLPISKTIGAWLEEIGAR